jgi:cell division septation protein DedD
MRFEIGPGGGLVILLAVLVLSAAVFFLGIISGREIVRGERNQSHVVSIYPLPTGGPSASSPQATNSPAPVALATPKPSPVAAIASENMQPAPSLDHPAPPHAAHTDASTINRPAQTRHLGYKIMIEATMDLAAADQMTARLLGLGYTCRIVPIQTNGQTWYGMQVGPYPTEDAALAAQANLRAAYAARYINKTGAASAETRGTAGAADTNSDGSSHGKVAPPAPTD